MDLGWWVRMQTGLPHRAVMYCLSHQEAPSLTEQLLTGNLLQAIQCVLIKVTIMGNDGASRWLQGIHISRMCINPNKSLIRGINVSKPLTSF